jgi:hypothetical protein
LAIIGKLAAALVVSLFGLAAQVWPAALLLPNGNTAA